MKQSTLGIQFNAKLFGQTIKVIRTDLNVSLAEFARINNLSKATLSRIERGRTSNVTHFLQLLPWTNCEWKHFIIPPEVSVKS